MALCQLGGLGYNALLILSEKANGMSWMKKSTLLVLSAVSLATASPLFIVQSIHIEGLQRINERTVLSYLPVHVGQAFTSQDSENIINTLYKTGLFSDVKLLRVGNTLIVRVSEQPVISLVSVTGNKKIDNKKLDPVLKKLGITEGSTYDATKLKEIAGGLQAQYAELGYYAATVDTQVEQASRNRVAIYIKVKEGPIAKVKKIIFIGNKAFSQSQLKKEFTLTTPGLFTLLNHHDRYAESQLDADLQHLQDFYFNHGYLRYHLVSKSVDISDDHKTVKITVMIDEGDLYHIKDYRLTVGDNIDKAAVSQRITLKPGQIFSRQHVMDTDKSIANYFADKGYAFPNIQVTPEINNADKTVILNFDVRTGSRIYVRHIDIAGNTRTKDYVVRTKIRQMEEAVYSRKNIEESSRNIRNLPYLSDVSVDTLPVPAHPDQVDLNYHVKEVDAGRASLQGGYSDVDGFLYGASVTEPNFMGSGKYVGVGFQNSAYQQYYHVDYSNPFYTIDGMSRAFSVYYTHTTPGNVNLENYTMNDIGGSVTYGVPLTEFTSWNFGGGYDHDTVANINPAQVSPSVVDFTNNYGDIYDQFNATIGISRATLDRAIFPTTGSTQGLSLTVGVPVLSSSLGFYKAVYNAHWYFPLGAGFIVSPHATLGYGNGLGDVNSLPFFDNFYAGGIDTLPGFEPNTLGPKNPNNMNTSIGGNVQILGGLNMIFPNGISEKLRTAAILDAGNVFSTYQVTSPPGTPQTQYENVSLDNLRVTTGIMVSWFWPLGAPINFSIAEPINKKPTDQTAIFGFSFGTDI